MSAQNNQRSNGDARTARIREEEIIADSAALAAAAAESARDGVAPAVIDGAIVGAPVAPTVTAPTDVTAMLAAIAADPTMLAAISAALAGNAPAAAPVATGGAALTTVRNFSRAPLAVSGRKSTAEWVAVVLGCDAANDGAFFANDQQAAYFRALSVVDGYRARGGKWSGNGKSAVWQGRPTGTEDIAAGARFIAYMRLAEYEAFRTASAPGAAVTNGQEIDAAHALRAASGVADPLMFAPPAALTAPVAEPETAPAA